MAQPSHSMRMFVPTIAEVDLAAVDHGMELEWRQLYRRNRSRIAFSSALAAAYLDRPRLHRVAQGDDAVPARSEWRTTVFSSGAEGGQPCGKT